MSRSDLMHAGKFVTGFIPCVFPRTYLVHLSTVDNSKISYPSWVNIQSAGWVNIQSALTLARQSLNGQMVTAEQMATALGERIFGTAVNGANSLYSHIQESSKSIPAMHAELFNVAKELFPDERFIKVQSEA